MHSSDRGVHVMPSDLVAGALLENDATFLHKEVASLSIL